MDLLLNSFNLIVIFHKFFPLFLIKVSFLFFFFPLKDTITDSSLSIA